MFFSKRMPATEHAATERRRSVRHATVMQVAKVRLAGGREELCLLRDVSPEGLRAEIYLEAAAGDPVEIELRSGHKVGGTVAWVEGGDIGVAFDEAMPMAALLAHCSFGDRLARLRPPRLTVNLIGILRVDFVERVVRIANISQSGLQISAPDPLNAGAPCAIALPDLPPRPATVRWWRERQAGLMLAEPFEYPEFAAWRAMSGRAAQASRDSRS